MINAIAQDGNYWNFIDNAAQKDIIIQSKGCLSEVLMDFTIKEVVLMMFGLKKILTHGQILSELMLLEIKSKNFDWNQNYKVCIYGSLRFGSYCVLKDEDMAGTKFTKFVILVIQEFSPKRKLAMKDLIRDQNYRVCNFGQSVVRFIIHIN